MPIDLAAAKLLVGDNDQLSSALDIIEPYLPILKRMGKSGLDAFLASVRQQDWTRIDRALYEAMTEAERDALGGEVLKKAREAVKLAYESSRQWQEDMLKLAFGLLLSAI